jgi:hypothetical protein
MSALLGICGVILILCFYFWPTSEAYRRKNKNCVAIFILNLLLGWTVIGWVIAMVWAFVN